MLVRASCIPKTGMQQDGPHCTKQKTTAASLFSHKLSNEIDYNQRMESFCPKQETNAVIIQTIAINLSRIIRYLAAQATIHTVPLQRHMAASTASLRLASRQFIDIATDLQLRMVRSQKQLQLKGISSGSKAGGTSCSHNLEWLARASFSRITKPIEQNEVDRFFKNHDFLSSFLDG